MVQVHAGILELRSSQCPIAMHPQHTHPRRARPRRGAERVRLIARGLVQRVAGLLAADPERIQTAIEVGLVRREWLEDPLGEPVSTTARAQVVQRFLEREVEAASVDTLGDGMSALQILKTHDDDSTNGVANLAGGGVHRPREGFTPSPPMKARGRVDAVAAHALAVGRSFAADGGTSQTSR